MKAQTVDFDPAREAAFEEELRAITLAVTKGLDCEVFLFGSRARGSARRSSDFDLGIRGLSSEDFARVRRRIEEAVEESHILHDVDVVDFERAAEPFRSAALEGRIVWKSD